MYILKFEHDYEELQSKPKKILEMRSLNSMIVEIYK